MIKIIFIKLPIFITILLITSCVAYLEFRTPVKIEKDIDLSTKGNFVEINTGKIAENNYRILLSFNKQNLSNNETMRKFLLGSDKLSSGYGTIIPIKVIVYKLHDNQKIEILDKVYHSKGISSYCTTDLVRDITGYGELQLSKGNYTILIETLENFDALKNVKTTVIFTEYSLKQ